MAKSLLKKISYVRETVDKETNKTTLIESVGVLPNEPHFVKLYLDGIMLYADCPSWQNKVLHALLKRVEYKTNELNLPSGQKTRIVEELEISMSSLNNAISTFVKRGLLIRTGKGVFLANPHLFGNGDWNTISKLRLTVDFSAEGITMKGDVQSEEKATEGDAPTRTIEQDIARFEAINREVEKDDSGQESVLNEAKAILLEKETAYSTLIPGLTPERLQWLREVVEANTVQISILGLFSCSFHSILQLVNTLSL